MDVKSDIEERLRDAGYNRVATEAQVDATLWCAQEQQRSKFGLARTLVAMVDLEGGTGSEALMAVSRETFSLCRSISGRLPERPNYLLVYIVMVTRRTEHTDRFLEQHRPRHWKAREFPVVLDEETRQLFLNRKRTVWGAAYYAGHVATAERLFNVT